MNNTSPGGGPLGRGVPCTVTTSSSHSHSDRPVYQAGNWPPTPPGPDLSSIFRHNLYSPASATAAAAGNPLQSPTFSYSPAATDPTRLLGPQAATLAAFQQHHQQHVMQVYQQAYLRQLQGYGAVAAHHHGYLEPLLGSHSLNRSRPSAYLTPTSTTPTGLPSSRVQMPPPPVPPLGALEQRSLSESESLARFGGRFNVLAAGMPAGRLHANVHPTTARLYPLSGEQPSSATPARLPPTGEPSGRLPLQPYYPSHFMKGTMIQLANGELKRVEELNTDDFIGSAQASRTLKMDSSTVVKIEEKTKDTVLICFSVGEHKVQVRKTEYYYWNSRKRNDIASGVGAGDSWTPVFRDRSRLVFMQSAAQSQSVRPAVQ